MPAARGRARVHEYPPFLFALSYPLGRTAEGFFHSALTAAVTRAGALYLGAMFYGFIVVILIDIVRLINRFFLWCDLHLKHDIHTLGWTFVARKPAAVI